jgi:MOSC domain-containing protein YiiM
MTGRVIGLSVKPETKGEVGLPKRPVASLAISAQGAQGDYNRYRTRTLRGDPDSALLLLTRDVLDALHQEGWAVEPGHLGENVLLEGIGNDGLAPGKRVALGKDVVVEVTRECEPCSELYELPYIGQTRGPGFVRTLLHRRGWYARVVTAGTVARGDSARLLD